MAANEPLYRGLGQRIMKKRKALGWSQEQLAEKASLSPQAISITELGKKSLRSENLLNISIALGVSTDYLLTGKMQEPETSLLVQKLSSLTPAQLSLVEDIIDSCLKLCSMENKNRMSNL